MPPDEHPWIETHGCTATYRALRDGIRAHYREHFPLTAAARAARAAQPGRVLRLAPRATSRGSRSRCSRRCCPAAVDLRLEHAPVAAETEGDRDRGGHAARRRRGHGGGRRLVPRRERVRRPAAAGRRRARHRLRGDRRAARAAEDQPRQPPAGHGLLRRRPPRGRGPHDPAARPLRRVRAALQLGRAGPADEPPGRAVAGAEPGGGRARDRARLRRPRPRQGPLALPPHRRARAVRARRLRVGHHARELAAGRLPRRGRARRARGRRARAQPELPALDADRGRLPGPAAARRRRRRHARRPRQARLHPRAAAAARGHDRASSRTSPDGPARFPDSVGIGAYRIDLHPSTGGDPYLDLACHPFEIPLGALVPQRVENLVGAGKAIGTTHITNGAYRLHPVEWNVGEAAGHLVAHCAARGDDAAGGAGGAGGAAARAGGGRRRAGWP